MGLAVAVFHSYLALAVGTQVGQRAVLAHGGQALHQAVGQVNGQRHQAVGLVAGEPDHHSLVASAGRAARIGLGAVVAGLQRGADAGVDVRRLLAGVADDAAGIAVDPVFELGVADLKQGLARDGVEVQVSLGRDFAGDHDQVLAGHGLAGHAAHGIDAQGGVQHGVGDLVTHLVGVPFGHRLGREQVLGRGHKLNWHCSVPPNDVVLHTVIPAFAGIQDVVTSLSVVGSRRLWIPAEAGMTVLVAGGSDCSRMPQV